MSQTLILELSDEIYVIIQRQAEAAGTSPARWLAKALEQQFGPPHTRQRVEASHTETEQQTARERFERHFGQVDLVDAIGADNEHIDADLAREYADSHEMP